MKIDTEMPFGAYRLSGRQKLAAGLTKKFQSKPVINFIRQIGGLRSCKIADVEVFGGAMRVYPSTNRCDKIMLGMPHKFDADERKALAGHLKKFERPVFLDVGANIGAYSLFVNELGLDAKIVAIEADPEMFARLTFNMPENIARLNFAIADQEGVLPFYINENNRGENSLVEGEGKKIEVPAKTLLQIMQENGAEEPTAMKIDIEGMEFKVLQKFFEEAAQNNFPKLVILEYIHSQNALDLLLSKGYKEVLRTKLNIVLEYV